MLFRSDKKIVKVNCATAADVAAQINKNKGNLAIVLTGNKYVFTDALTIVGNVSISSNNKQVNVTGSEKKLSCLFEIKGGSTLAFNGLNIVCEGLNADALVSADRSGSVNHSNFSINSSKIANLTGDLFYGSKATMLDSIVVSRSAFTNIKGTVFNFNNEDDKKGYYNVEKYNINNNTFSDNNGQLMNILRGGNDESTMGPLLLFTNNKITNTQSTGTPLIKLYGVQRSFITGNSFTNANSGGTLLLYEDAVRAVHILNSNKINASGNIVTDKFVESKN